MKIKPLMSIFFASTSLCWLSSLSASATDSLKDEKVILSADIYCPFNCQSGAKEPGIMVEVAQKAFGDKNLTYTEITWKRAIQEAIDGHIDGLFGTVPSTMPEFIHSKTIGRSILCFYVHKDDAWVYKVHDSIKGKKLGVIAGYSYPDFVTAHINNKELNKNTELSGDGVLLNLLKMLNIKRIDTVIEDESVIANILKSNPDLAGNIKQAGCISDPESIYDLSIGFPKKSQAKSERLLKKLNETIDEMIKNGEMDKLLKKYSMKKWW